MNRQNTLPELPQESNLNNNQNMEQQGKKFYREEYQPYPQGGYGRKEVVKYRKPRGGCLNTGCGCRMLSCVMLIMILLLVGGIIYFLATKPRNLWGSVVTFLNADAPIPSFTSTKDVEEVKQEINSQVTIIGDTDVVINQEQLTVLARNKYGDTFKNLVIKIDPDALHMYWDLDKTIEDNPLKGEIIIKLDQTNKLYLDKLGVPRVGLPPFMNSFLTSTFYSLLSIGNSNKDEKYGFLVNLVPANNMKIKEVDFDNGKLHLKTTVSVNLFNQ